jgi:HAD superfamily hydrolase (TIGR01509 family)
MTLLIFDCDGVLVDSEPIATGALAEMITSLGHPMTLPDAVATFTGRSVADVLALIQKLLGSPVPEEFGARHAQEVLARFRRELKPVPGVEDAIAALPYRRCVASSSSPERLLLSLEVTGLAPLFGQNVFSAVHVKNGKPAPDLFLHAARRMQEAPADCIVIEDTVPGVQAGVAAGMAVIGFAGGGHADAALADRLAAAGARTVVRSMRELPATVLRTLGRDEAPH